MSVPGTIEIPGVQRVVVLVKEGARAVVEAEAGALIRDDVVDLTIGAVATVAIAIKEVIGKVNAVTIIVTDEAVGLGRGAIYRRDRTGAKAITDSRCVVVVADQSTRDVLSGDVTAGVARFDLSVVEHTDQTTGVVADGDHVSLSVGILDRAHAIEEADQSAGVSVTGDGGQRVVVGDERTLDIADDTADIITATIDATRGTRTGNEDAFGVANKASDVVVTEDVQRCAVIDQLRATGVTDQSTDVVATDDRTVG